MVAELMAISARTAPKSAGQDFVEIEIIEGKRRSKAGRRDGPGIMPGPSHWEESPSEDPEEEECYRGDDGVDKEDEH
jgi:hypothetical protein